MTTTSIHSNSGSDSVQSRAPSTVPPSDSGLEPSEGMLDVEGSFLHTMGVIAINLSRIYITLVQKVDPVYDDMGAVWLKLLNAFLESARDLEAIDVDWTGLGAVPSNTVWTLDTRNKEKMHQEGMSPNPVLYACRPLVGTAKVSSTQTHPAIYARSF